MRRGWRILLAFIGGTIFAEISVDPTDYLFFQLKDRLTAEQSAAMWYFLAAAFYSALFLAAYLVARTGVLKPEHIVYIMAGLIIFGAVLSWRTLSAQGASAENLVLILGIPLITSLAILKGLRKELG